MQETVPRRIVLRFDEKYELEWAAIIRTYLAPLASDVDNDFYPHLMAPNMSSKMHVVLDLPCKTIPSVDPSSVEYAVYKVKKTGELYVDLPLDRTRADYQIVSSSNLMITLVRSLESVVQG